MRKLGVVICLVAGVVMLDGGCDKKGVQEDTSLQQPAPASTIEPVTEDGPAADNAGESPTEQQIRLVVPGRGALTIAIPEDMVQKEGGPEVPGGVSMCLEGSEPDPHFITLTVLGEPGMMPGFGSKAWVEDELERWKESLPIPADEAVPVEFHLENIWGMYVTLEDPSPTPGKYPYLLQGFFNVDGCILAFQVLHAVPRASAANRFLAPLLSASWEPEADTAASPASG